MKTLMLVHAHPDDESILTGGVTALAHDDGHRVVLVTITRGESDEFAPAGETGGVADIGEIRVQELRAACDILGVDRMEILGYRGSGMDPTAGGNDSATLRVTPLFEAAERLARVLDAERPDVVVTYSEDGTYGHPDHVKTYETTMAALDLLAGQGWGPSKVYLHAVPHSLVEVVVAAARAAGIELPAELVAMAGVPDDRITTHVDVSAVLDRKLAACVAHSSQMQPGLPLAIMAAQLFEVAFGIEHFVLVGGAMGSEQPESSLFDGL